MKLYLRRQHSRFFHWVGRMLSRHCIYTADALSQGIIDEVMRDYEKQEAKRTMSQHLLGEDTPTETITRTQLLTSKDSTAKDRLN